MSTTIDRAWHVGDSLKLDVAGPRAASLTAVWVNRPGRAREPADPPRTSKCHRSPSCRPAARRQFRLTRGSSLLGGKPCQEVAKIGL